MLDALNVLVSELDHPARLNVDQVIVMAARRLLIASPPRPEIVPLENAIVGEQLQRAIDRGEGDAGVDRVRPTMHFLDVRMVLGVRKNAGDYPPLTRHAQPLVGTKPLDATSPFRRYGHVLSVRCSIR